MIFDLLEQLLKWLISFLPPICFKRRINIKVDLIAKDGESLVFIEIKTRKGKSLGYAKEAIDGRKRRQLSKVALAYMKSNNCCDTKSRFDVVAINLSDEEDQIEVIRNAFDLEYP